MKKNDFAPGMVFHYGNQDFFSVRPTQPIRVLFLTSVRDIGLCDHNGDMVTTPDGLMYMRNIIEQTSEAIARGGRLNGLIEIVGIITDDTEQDLAGSDYSATFMRGKKWIFSPSCVNAKNVPLVNITMNIPSSFRTLPINDTVGRKKRKQVFEIAVLEAFEDLNADIIVSDHYMARLEYLHIWLPGRILNIHPAVTVAGHEFCFRGKTPTMDAINQAKVKSIKTGATFHIINENIDEGPVIAYYCPTIVRPDDEPQWLRYRNYQKAKLPLFIEGMRHYVFNIFPYLGKLDLSTLGPRSSVLIIA